jgi:MFS family permease
MTAGTDRSTSALAPTLVGVGTAVAIISSLGAPLIPTIAANFHVSLSTAEWVLTAALLTGGVVTPITGRLADGPRQREVILGALTTVMIGSVLSAVATSFPLLVVGRGMQGVGLGLLPVTMAIARANLPPEKVAKTIAALSISSIVGVGLGFPLTSVFSEIFNVRAAFWFGAGIVGCALAAALIVVPRPVGHTPQGIDLSGVVILTLTVTGILIVLSEGSDWGWSSPKAVGTLIACAVLTPLWIRYELRTKDPLVDLRQLRHRSILTADISVLFIAVAMYLFIPIVVEFVQVPRTSGYGLGASVIVSGLLLTPFSAGGYVASRLLVPFSRRFGRRALIPLGSVIFAVSSFFYAWEHRSLWEAFVSVGAAGVGVGFSFGALPGFIVRAVPSSETGSALGFYQVLQRIGGSIGSALAGAILAVFTHKGMSFPMVKGFEEALEVASGLAVVTGVLSYVLSGRIAETAGPATADSRAAAVAMKENAELALEGGVVSPEDPIRPG